MKNKSGLIAGFLLIFNLVSTSALANSVKAAGGARNSGLACDQTRSYSNTGTGAGDFQEYSYRLNPCHDARKYAKDNGVINCIEKLKLSASVCEAGRYIEQHSSGAYQVGYTDIDAGGCQCDSYGILAL